MARRGGEGDDKDKPMYDCSDCGGETRVARRCNVEPYEEIQEYQEFVRTHRLKDGIGGATAQERRTEACEILKAGRPPGLSDDACRLLVRIVRRVMQVEDARINAERVDEQEGHGPFGVGSKCDQACPMLHCTPSTDRWMVQHRRAQALTAGMGGGVSWTGRGAAHEDSRMLDAFSVISAAHAEARRG